MTIADQRHKPTFIALLHAAGGKYATIVDVVVQFVVQIFVDGGILKGQLKCIQLNTAVLDGASEEILKSGI